MTTVKLSSKHPLFIIVLSLLVAVNSPAAISVKSYWRLGESDPGANSGQIVTNATQGGSGTGSLRAYGNPRYTNDVGTDAARHAGSSLAISFNGAGQHLSNDVVNAISDNFGLEAWVKTRAASQAHVVAENGNTSTAGWAIRQFGATWQGEITGRDRFGTAPVVVNVWTHLALVRADGVATLYVNGVAAGTSAAAPATPAGGFTIGAYLGGNAPFNGIIDEVRTFSFLPGAFRTNDLLLNAPPPVPTVVTQWVAGMSVGQADLRASIQPNGNATKVYFRYGPTTNYGSFTATNSLPSDGSALTVSNSASGLATCETYHCQAVAVNAAGEAFGPDRTFTMSIAPEAETGTYLDVSTNGATIQGIVRPNGAETAAWFDWGSTTNYGEITAATTLDGGESSALVSIPLSGLSAGTYHFRLVAHSCGGIVRSYDRVLYVPRTIVVTSLAGRGPGSLRAAIADAAPGDTIELRSQGMIELATGEIVITNDLILAGPGASQLTLSGGNANRLFTIAGQASVTISNLTLQNGRAQTGSDAGGTFGYGGAGENGGAVFNSGVLTLAHCVLLDNAAGRGGAGSNFERGGDGGWGGAISNDGTLTLLDCVLAHNAGGQAGPGLPTGSGGSGGAIFNRGSLLMSGCTLSTNAAGNSPYAQRGAGRGGSGGGIYNGGSGELRMYGCALYANTAGQAGGAAFADGSTGGHGGGIYNGNELMLVGCTIHGNSSGGGGSATARAGGNGGDGGGIYNDTNLRLVGCTVSGNRTGNGGAGGVREPDGRPGRGAGIWSRTDEYDPATSYCVNSLIALNIAPDAGTGVRTNDLSGAFVVSHALVSALDDNAELQAFGPFIVAPNPGLDVLADNGGPTLTQALLAGSPALNAGDDGAINVVGVDVDQRGFPRAAGGQVDIGAFEYQPPIAPLHIQSIRRGAKRAMELQFTNTPGGTFSAWATTNAALPRSAWTKLGTARPTAPGQFRFIDDGAMNLSHRFYELRSP